RGNETRFGTWSAGASGEQVTSTDSRSLVLKVLASVSFVSFVSSVLPAKPAAQMAAGPAGAGFKREAGVVSSALPPALREIGFDQNIDQRVPLDTMFHDESGATVRLGEYFGTRPVVLVFAYYDCPMLCTQV